MSIFMSNKEKNFIDGITRELINDVIKQSIIFYKINSEYTRESNIYGESSTKVFYPGIKFNALIEFLEPEILATNSGLSQTRELIIYSQKQYLSDYSIFPEEGDFMYWDDQYFEITKVFDIKNLEGLPDKKINIQIETKSSDSSQINIIGRR